MPAPLRRARLRADDGQAVGALIMLVAFLLLALVTYVIWPLGAAANGRARSRTAADAAALAGAEEIRTTWLTTSVPPGLLMFPHPPLVPVTPVSGQAAATTYAARNGSGVVRYTADPSAGQVYVHVRANETSHQGTTGRAESEATAEMDIDFSACRWVNGVPPSPVPSGPPTFVDTLECGAWSASYLITNGNGVYPTISWTTQQLPQLYDALEPRLVE